MDDNRGVCLALVSPSPEARCLWANCIFVCELPDSPHMASALGFLAVARVVVLGSSVLDGAVAAGQLKH